MRDAGYELISVVIPSRNRRVQLERAIASVRRQTWPNIEIIVVDDASSDDTPSYLKRLVDSRTDVLSVRNERPQGGAGARNKGIDVARGDYVAFLDDDDTWLPEKLQTQVALLKASPFASAASCSFFMEHGFGKRTVIRLFPTADTQQILRTNHLGGASMCMAASHVLREIGGFDPKLRSGQDWDLWIKLTDRGPVLVCPEPLVCYMPHEGARITSNPSATYAGRRRIYLRYKSRMTHATRLHHINELLYCRKVELPQGRLDKLAGLFEVVRFAGIRAGIRYCYRYARQMLVAGTVFLARSEYQRS